MLKKERKIGEREKVERETERGKKERRRGRKGGEWGVGRRKVEERMKQKG